MNDHKINWKENFGVFAHLSNRIAAKQQNKCAGGGGYYLLVMAT